MQRIAVKCNELKRNADKCRINSQSLEDTQVRYTLGRKSLAVAKEHTHTFIREGHESAFKVLAMFNLLISVSTCICDCDYLYLSAYLCISLQFSSFLFSSLHFSAFIYLSLNLSAFLLISLHFSTFLCISLHFMYIRTI